MDKLSSYNFADEYMKLKIQDISIIYEKYSNGAYLHLQLVGAIVIIAGIDPG